MQPLRRILIASTALSLTPAFALAQNVPPAPASSQPEGGLVGPPQLSNFSLQGKVTQQATPHADAIAPQRQPAAAKPVHAAPPDERAAAGVAPKAPARESRQAEIAARHPPAAPATAARTRPDPLQAFAGPPRPAPRSASPAIGQVTAGDSPAASSVDSQPMLDTQHSGYSGWLWTLAALVAAAAAGWYFLWQRPRAKLLPAGLSRFDLSPADPLTASRPASPPPPTVATPKPKSSGIVSTRLRPWIDLQVTPERAIVDGERVVIEFTASIFNSGSAPARDLLVEAALFNAGPMQDSQIGAFFQNPVAKGERIPALEPMQRLAVRSAVTLARSQVVPVEIEGQRLLVPLIGFNALYRWGGSAGQTSTSYLVGKTTASSDKLAPFRLDAAPRIFRRLAAREYELRVRQ